MTLHNNLNNNISDIVFVTTKKISCNGAKNNSSKADGHPLVYLDVGKKGSVVCPYCSRLFTNNVNK